MNVAGASQPSLRQFAICRIHAFAAAAQTYEVMIVDTMAESCQVARGKFALPQLVGAANVVNNLLRKITLTG